MDSLRDSFNLVAIGRLFKIYAATYFNMHVERPDGVFRPDYGLSRPKL